ncbi:MAG: murein hydrolase activator EnvC family protein [Vicinamibacterales bacterium]
MASRSSSNRLLALGIAALAVLHAVALNSQAPADEAKAQAARAAERIQILQREADQLAAEARTVYGDLRQLEIARQIKIEEVVRADARLAELMAARDAAAVRLKTLESARIAGSPDVSSRLVELYKRGRGGYLTMLLATNDLRAIGRMARGVVAVAELDRTRIDDHRRSIAEERTALADLNRDGAALTTQQAEATKARVALDAAVAARNRLIDDLDRRRDIAAQFVGELQAAHAALQRTLASMPKGSGGAVPALPLPAFRGAIEWPVIGPIVSPFGRATSGRFGTAVTRNGVEIGAKEKSPVRAIHEGTAAFAAPFTGFGTLVIVEHGGGAFSLYGHLSQALVTKGAAVKRGSVVGSVGHTPTGVAALYFELRIDGRPVDPVQWLRR